MGKRELIKHFAAALLLGSGVVPASAGIAREPKRANLTTVEAKSVFTLGPGSSIAGGIGSGQLEARTGAVGSRNSARELIVAQMADDQLMAFQFAGSKLTTAYWYLRGGIYGWIEFKASQALPQVDWDHRLLFAKFTVPGATSEGLAVRYRINGRPPEAYVAERAGELGQHLKLEKH
jgi:hypothetical protein